MSFRFASMWPLLRVGNAWVQCLSSNLWCRPVQFCTDLHPSLACANGIGLEPPYPIGGQTGGKSVLLAHSAALRGKPGSARPAVRLRARNRWISASAVHGRRFHASISGSVSRVALTAGVHSNPGLNPSALFPL
jgi:hypothetical protein